MVASTVIGASASRQNGWSGGGKAPLPAASGAPWRPRTPGGPDVDHIAHRERRRRPQRSQRAAIGHGCVPVWSVKIAGKIVPASRVAAPRRVLTCAWHAAAARAHRTGLHTWQRAQSLAPRPYSSHTHARRWCAGAAERVWGSAAWLTWSPGSRWRWRWRRWRRCTARRRRSTSPQPGTRPPPTTRTTRTERRRSRSRSLLPTLCSRGCRYVAPLSRYFKITRGFQTTVRARRSSARHNAQTLGVRQFECWRARLTHNSCSVTYGDGYAYLTGFSSNRLVPLLRAVRARPHQLRLMQHALAALHAWDACIVR